MQEPGPHPPYLAISASGITGNCKGHFPRPRWFSQHAHLRGHAVWGSNQTAVAAPYCAMSQT